jgi:ribosomal protein S12 methylthiotransferase accessory factor
MTTLPGKDAPLEATLSTLPARLTALGFVIQERSWLHPISGVWSVHIRDQDCPLLFTNGKGNSRDAALASALGEFFERLSCRYFWSHYYLGESIAQATTVHHSKERWFALSKKGAWPEGLLSPTLREFYDPDTSLERELLVDRNSGNQKRGVCALPYTRHRDGETVYFPVAVLGSLYVSNGMAAGNTVNEARTQALSEVLERYVKFDVIRTARCLPDIPQAVIDGYPTVAQGIAELRAAGFGILVKDASLGGIYPVVNVTLLNPHDQGCFASFGAHPQFSVALERALTELLQGRGLDALNGFHAPGFDLEEIADASNLEIHFVDSSGIISWEFLRAIPDEPWQAWNHPGSTAEEFEWLCGLIEGKGHDIYIADYDDLGVYGCRIVVPGMSEIYPVDDLEWDNPSAANGLRPALLNLSALDSEACLDLLDQLENLGVADQQRVAAWIGLAADPDTLWHDLRIGELKTLLALAGEDHEAVLAGCDWIRQFEHMPVERQRVYRCISDLLRLDDAEPYLTSLNLLYGEETLGLAQAHLDGTQRFFHLSAPGMALQGCDLHQRLLQAYRKVSPWLAVS